MTKKHQHRVTREMLEGVLEDFARAMYRAHGGTEAWKVVVRRANGKTLMMLLENVVLDGRRAMLPTVIPACNVRDLISAEEALAVFEAAVARAREVEEQS